MAATSAGSQWRSAHLVVRWTLHLRERSWTNEESTLVWRDIALLWTMRRYFLVWA
jgi:hypothetical protein